MPLLSLATSVLGGSSLTNASATASNIVDSANGTASLDIAGILNTLDGFGLNVVSGLSNLFANGMDFSCWNSSYNPQEAQKDITADIPFALKWSGFQDNPNSATLNKLMTFIYSYRDDAQNGQKLVKCSAKGHKMREDAISQFENSIMAVVRDAYNVVNKGFVNGELYIPSGVPYRRGQAYRWRYVNCPVYEITLKKQLSAPPNDIPQGGSGGLPPKEQDFLNNYQPDVLPIDVGDQVIDIKNPIKENANKSSGFPWWLGLLLFI